MKLVTTEFSEDLDRLRQSKDFHDKSLALLIRGLKEGADMFNQEERNIILGNNK
jgi:hypothetical protein